MGKKRRWNLFSGFIYTSILSVLPVIVFKKAAIPSLQCFFFFYSASEEAESSVPDNPSLASLHTQPRWLAHFASRLCS